MNLRDTLILALNGNERSVNTLCDHFRRMSVAYLRTKAHRNSFLLDHLYKDIDDLALDCIADLFGTEGNCLIEIKRYLDGDDIETMSESEISTKLRRLVFSKVNEGLYRNYGDLDPSLSKIIRNLKRTLDEHKVEGMSYNSETGHIVLEGCDKEGFAITDEILEIKLSASISDISNTVEAVEALKRILGEEDYSYGQVPLVGFAILLRKAFAYQLKMEQQEKLKKEKPSYEADEIRSFIQESIAEERTRFVKTYVQSGKLSEKYLDDYLLTVKNILEGEFIEVTPLEGYYEHFAFHFPEITYERYRSDYRKIIEYMVKNVRSNLIFKLRAEQKFSSFG